MSDKSSGGWELTKENIQPLSSGRRMACLKESLPNRTAGGLTDQLEYEEHHMNEIMKLAEVAEKKLGDDPLQSWLHIVTYFEQHFPNMSPAVHTKYLELLQRAIKLFYRDESSKDDKRYVELITKNVAMSPIPVQIRLLRSFLNFGHGKRISDMYVRLAELYKKEGDTKRASEVLNEGVQNNAEPKQLLNEMLTHVQLSWAEGFAKQLQEANNGQQSEGERNFATSVPIYGENNEAVSIRQNLQPAAPTGPYSQRTTNDRRHREVSRLPVFNEEEGGQTQSYTENGNVKENDNPLKFENLGEAECDRENRLEASKWNGEDARLNNPAIEPPKKLKLYAESDSFHAPSKPMTKKPPLPLNKHVLKERLVDDEGSKDPVPQTRAIPEPPISKNYNKVDTDVHETNKVNLPPRIHSVVRPRRNYNPKVGDNFFEDVKYKFLPEDGPVDYVGLKEDLWWERAEERRKQSNESGNIRILELQKIVDQLQMASSESSQSLKKLTEQLRLADVKLMQKNEKIKSLETQNETLLQQLTDLTTRNNVMESQYHREKSYLENKVQELTQAKASLEQELENYKAELEGLQEKVARQGERQQMNDNESSEYEGITIEKNSSSVDRRPITIDVRSRNSDDSSSAEQISSEISRFNSGDTTCAAANSFMPNEYDSSIIGNGNKTGSESLRDRMALFDRPLENDMMNDTPATAPPMDFEIPPLCFSYGSAFFKKPERLNLYESYSHSQNFSLRKTSKGGSFNTGSKKSEIASSQENLPCSFPQGTARCFSNENAPVTTAAEGESIDSQPTFVPDNRNQTIGASSSSSYQSENVAQSLPFLRPDLPSFKKPTFQSNENAYAKSSHTATARTAEPDVPVASNVTERLALLSTRHLNHYPSEEDEEDVIVRRHQQTGMDLNVSNLTTALLLGPKPLTNSTPERERTLRNLRGLAPAEVRNVNTQLEFEDTTGQDYQGGISSRASRYNSVLNDPPLSLSTIQETSRENRSRSRSTTGSSSGNTMSSTRFGITGTTTSTSTTPFYGNITRSASIPRSANRVSQQHGSNYNGYYSDTNK